MPDADIDDLDAQIAKLQAQKAAKLAYAVKMEERRVREEQKVLVGGTPTKSKPLVEPAALPVPPKQPAFVRSAVAPLARSTPASSSTVPVAPPVTAKPSAMSARMAERRTKASAPALPVVPRSLSFTNRAAPEARALEHEDELEVVHTGAERAGGDLTVVEQLQMGPGTFGKDPEGEEAWEHLEPNSGIRLSKRLLPHTDVQANMHERYFIPPSQLYSVARLSRDGATYDIPVDNDWLTIAVVAERSDIRVSGTKVVGSDDEDDEDFDKAAQRPPARAAGAADDKVASRGKQGRADANGNGAKRKGFGNKRGPRKYLNLKLCALGSRAKGSSGGDALLQLLLFEADAVIHGDLDEDGKRQKIYTGGSGGAYEQYCNVAVGTVLAILNPRILRPLKAGAGGPHPLTLPLALNPTSGDSVIVIGQAMDLGRCQAMQRDGNRCKAWVDIRVNQVCDYHVETQMKRIRGGRGETASAQTAYSVAASSASGGLLSRPAKPDPKRRNGLQARGRPQAAPRGLDNGGGGATYMTGSRIVRTGAAPAGPEHLAEKLGRGRAERRKRKLEQQEADALMARLRAQDSGSTGAKYLAAAEKKRAAMHDKASGADGKRKRADADADGKENGEAGKRTFSASAIKLIGFDPSSRGLGKAAAADSLNELRDKADRPLKLGRTGPRILSSVKAPSSAPAAVDTEAEAMIDLSDEE